MSAPAISSLDFRVLQLASAEIGKLIEERTVLLAGGMAPDFAAYKNACGYIAGLNAALEIISHVNKSIFETREERA